MPVCNMGWRYTRHTSSCLGVACAQTAESHSVSMLIDCLSFAPTSNSNYLGYIRHTSSCLGVASIQAVQSHSVSMLIIYRQRITTC